MSELTRLRVAVVIEPDGEGYSASCPAFEGLHMDGSTEEEVLERVHEGIEAYLHSLARHGDQVPVGPFCQVEGDGSDHLSQGRHRRVHDTGSRFVAQPNLPLESLLCNLEVECLATV